MGFKQRFHIGQGQNVRCRVLDLAQDYNLKAEEIAEILDLDLGEVRSLMPSQPKRYELVDLDTGRTWPAHSPRKAYMMAQLYGLTAHECRRAGEASQVANVDAAQVVQ